ncbi:hypothetical protein E2562_037480 [Oryza meyeriana var. granulata]|uniref:Protein kinase domain-containing protein n=1 Tax=Oryza meyeriana var. granulata TaxID=110450 RepID=A0A6G1EU04_9ORYZ|nr:hypothetical protein E2562_037480 [Oryza meyeriana var. granulata]
MPPGNSPAITAANTYSKVLQGRYELGHVLGCGASSKVYHARDTHTGAHVTVKAIRKPQHSCCLPEAAEREIAALHHVREHPCCIYLQAWPHDALDVADHNGWSDKHGSMANASVLLSSILPPECAIRTSSVESGSWDGTIQLASTVAHAHSLGVFHHDVKPDNLLLDDRGDLKLIEFGLSAFANQHLGVDGLATMHCGSLAYVTPEILLKRRYDTGKAEWSCGVVLFVLTAGYLPFNDGNLMAMYRKICSGKFRCPKWCSPELRSLIGRMLDPEPDNCIKIGEIFDHPWFQQDGKSSFGIIQAASSHPNWEAVKWEA